MDLFNFLTMIGGLSLFLFGMNIMGQGLERSAGNSLQTVLSKMTGNKLAGLLTGIGVTAIIQSSSATTVMVVGFVNSELLTLRQAISVIMGANVGTTMTAWLLSLGSISGDAIWVRMLKPSSFTPLLALIGIILYMFCKSKKKKDIGMVLLGFATLMFGMEAMTGAVACLKDNPTFQNLFLLFSNPLMGVLAGAILTGIIQSSSASVGILQALAASGGVSYGAAIPIIMGQNIGTCVTAMISSIGTNKNARRTALVHLAFNVIGTAVCLVLFVAVKALFAPILLGKAATMSGIAITHTLFNIFCTIILLPAAGLLEKLVVWLVPNDVKDEKRVELDERLIATPAVAIRQSRQLIETMSCYTIDSLKKAMSALDNLTPSIAEEIRRSEDVIDHYEDILGSYLLKISSSNVLGDRDSEDVTEMLKFIGDFERLGDHAVNILESAEELNAKGLKLSPDADKELSVLRAAVCEVLDIAQSCFISGDVKIAVTVEPLEQVIDDLKEQLRTNHIIRMKKGECSIDAGFIWSDLLTNLERVSDHCSNIAGCVLDRELHTMNMHETLRNDVENSDSFAENYREYKKKYSLS